MARATCQKERGMRGEVVREDEVIKEEAPWLADVTKIEEADKSGKAIDHGLIDKQWEACLILQG